MINNVTIPNDTNLVVVCMKEDEDSLKFATDLKNNLENFKLVKIDPELKSITFYADAIDLSESIASNAKNVFHHIDFKDKVLIRNKRVVLNNCTPLILHKILILKQLS